MSRPGSSTSTSAPLKAAPVPHIWSAADYGGTESVGWETAAAAATIHEARLGNLAEAQS